MKKLAVLIVILIVLISHSVSAGNGSVEAYIVDRDIYYTYRHNLGIDSEYPVLSYNDNTYISVRSFAKAVGYDAVWDNFSRSITMMQPSEDKYLVKSDSMALAMGKAIIEEYFGDEITEYTRYFAGLGYLQTREFDVYKIYVTFNIPEEFDTEKESNEYILTHPDCIVDIDPVKGEVVSFRRKDENGNLKNVLDTIIG